MVYGIRIIKPCGLKNGSVWSSVWAHEFDIKHLKKAERHMGQNILIIIMKMKTIVWIQQVIKYIKFYLRNSDLKYLYRMLVQCIRNVYV